MHWGYCEFSWFCHLQLACPGTALYWLCDSYHYMRTEGGQTKEKGKHDRKQNIKATSIHMEVRALFGRNAQRASAMTSTTSSIDQSKVHFLSEAVWQDNRAVRFSPTCIPWHGKIRGFFDWRMSCLLHIEEPSIVFALID